MRELSYAEAMVEALDEALGADERVTLIGSYFLGLSPRRVLLDRLREKYGGRMFDPPIAELGYVGVGVGAALTGLRPIVDVATASFVFHAWPQIVNEAANARYMSGGGTAVPMVLHMLTGLRGGGAAQHSHSPQAMLWNTPGLEIIVPATPYDVKGLLRSAVASDNPTVFIDHGRLFEVTGDVPIGDYSVPLGQAAVRREGRDVTIVATSLMVHRAMQAATILVESNIEVEVVDLRTLVPLDRDTLLRSVMKTGRVVIADECHLSCGAGGELAAIIADEAFHALKAPVRRVGTPDVPVPFSPSLEVHIEPTSDRIVAAVHSVVGWSGQG
jgi:pyruvate dehydrogenase E1 component beta subunit